MASNHLQETVIIETRPHISAGFVIFAICLPFFWLVIPAFFAAWEYWRIRCTKYSLTTERVVVESGIFNRKIEQIELYRLKDIGITMSILQRLFGVATLRLVSTDRTTPDLYLESIADTGSLREKLREASEHLRATKRRIW